MYGNCVEIFAHVECYSDCSHRGAIWLNPFATVLFNVCSAITVECCFSVPVLYPISNKGDKEDILGDSTDIHHGSSGENNQEM